MKIRRYKGPSREELYKTILREMGPSAVVINAANSESGLFGRRQEVELIAILEDAAGASDPPPPGTRTATAAEADELRRLRRQQQHQWRDMQRALEGIRENIQDIQKTRDAPPPQPEPPPHARSWDPRFCEWARSACPSLVGDDPEQARADLARHLPLASEFPFRHSDRKPHIVVLVGPTGSGKTTTLAKLATIAALQKKLKVGIVTADTYRIAAVDQIREYAGLIGADLRVVFSAAEARNAISALAGNDVVFVDTPGRTHFDEMGLASVQGVLRGMGATTVLLTVPATLGRADLPDMMEGFSRFQPDYLVVTKVDETRHPAIFTSLPFESDRLVAFVTDGQRVPQDIYAANPQRIADLLVRADEPAPQGAPATPMETMPC
jgi:flagellar biosynthesis protein FlhF